MADSIKHFPPGSDIAIKEGCTCPVLDNGHGRGYLGNPGKFVMNAGCPVHHHLWPHKTGTHWTFEGSEQAENLRQEWPPTSFPCRIFWSWECLCGKKHISSFFSGELGDDDADSFDFHCECGEYFKKFSRVFKNTKSEPVLLGWRQL